MMMKTSLAMHPALVYVCCVCTVWIVEVRFLGFFLFFYCFLASVLCTFFHVHVHVCVSPFFVNRPSKGLIVAHVA